MKQGQHGTKSATSWPNEYSNVHTCERDLCQFPACKAIKQKYLKATERAILPFAPVQH